MRCGISRQASPFSVVASLARTRTLSAGRRLLSTCGVSTIASHPGRASTTRPRSRHSSALHGAPRWCASAFPPAAAARQLELRRRKRLCCKCVECTQAAFRTHRGVLTWERRGSAICAESMRRCMHALLDKNSAVASLKFPSEPPAQVCTNLVGRALPSRVWAQGGGVVPSGPVRRGLVATVGVWGGSARASPAPSPWSCSCCWSPQVSSTCTGDRAISCSPLFFVWLGARPPSQLRHDSHDPPSCGVCIRYSIMQSISPGRLEGSGDQNRGVPQEGGRARREARRVEVDGR